MLSDKTDYMEQLEKEALQSKRLRKLVEWAYKKNPFYEERMHKRELTPADITGIYDIDKLPLMDREDLSANYPYGLLTIPVSGIVRFQIIPGHNISVGFTQQDLLFQREITARSLLSCHINSASILLLTGILDISCMTVLQQAAEIIGATVISGRWENAGSILRTVMEFGVTAIFTTPEIMFELHDYMKGNGLDPGALPLLSMLSFYIPAGRRLELEKMFQLPVYCFYGRSDFLNIGIAADCHEKNGLHVPDDHIFPEIIDFHSGEVLACEEPGELVLTTLTREGMPLIRYRTGESACLESRRCSCGRTTPRLKFVRNKK